MNTDGLTDDEMGQIRELSRLFNIPFEALEETWRYNRKERAKTEEWI